MTWHIERTLYSCMSLYRPLKNHLFTAFNFFNVIVTVFTCHLWRNAISAISSWPESEVYHFNLTICLLLRKHFFFFFFLFFFFFWGMLNCKLMKNSSNKFVKTIWVRNSIIVYAVAFKQAYVFRMHMHWFFQSLGWRKFLCLTSGRLQSANSEILYSITYSCRMAFFQIIRSLRLIDSFHLEHNSSAVHIFKWTSPAPWNHPIWYWTNRIFKWGQSKSFIHWNAMGRCFNYNHILDRPKTWLIVINSISPLTRYWNKLHLYCYSWTGYWRRS